MKQIKEIRIVYLIIYCILRIFREDIINNNENLKIFSKLNEKEKRKIDIDSNNEIYSKKPKIIIEKSEDIKINNNTPYDILKENEIPSYNGQWDFEYSEDYI